MEQKAQGEVLGLLQSSEGMGTVGITQESLSGTIFPNQLPRESSGLQISPGCCCTILRNYHERFCFSQRNPHPHNHRAALTTHFKLNFPPCQSPGSKSHSPSQTVFPSPSAEGFFLSCFGFAVVVEISFGMVFFGLQESHSFSSR